MKTFTDNAGRAWTVTLNVAALKRVRSLAQVDLLDLQGGRVFERLFGDPVTLCDVLYAVCKPEADKAQVSDEDFGRSMAGDAIEHATRALIAELIAFFPNPRERAALSRVVQAMDAAMDRARTLAERRIESGELDRAIDEALLATPTAGRPSSASPA